VTRPQAQRLRGTAAADDRALGVTASSRAEQLLRGYLRLAPDPPDRAGVEQLLIELAVGNRLGCALPQADAADPTRVLRAERAVLEIDPGFAPSELGTPSADPVADLLPRILATCRYPSTVRTLARLRSILKDFSSAEILRRHGLRSVTGRSKRI